MQKERSTKFRPLASRSLRPGGTSLRPGGITRDYKGGAGSVTDHALKLNNGHIIDHGKAQIKYRYTKEMMFSLRSPNVSFPSHLKTLPSYLLRYEYGGNGVVGGFVGQRGQSNSNEVGQWGRGRLQQNRSTIADTYFVEGNCSDANDSVITTTGGNPGFQQNQFNTVGTKQPWQRHTANDITIPELTKAANPFLRGNQKKSKDSIAEVQSSVLAILNKLTPQTYEKLREQLLTLDINTAPLLEMLIGQIFDKVVDEAAFSELYAKLCADLDKSGPERWGYVKILHDRNKKEYYWVAGVSPEKDLIGPMSSEKSCIDRAAVLLSGNSALDLLRVDPNDVLLNKLMKIQEHVVKLYTSKTTKKYYFSLESFSVIESMAERDMAGGPYMDTIKNGVQINGALEAEKRGRKVTSLKRLLLNKCQEAFETGDIYAEIFREFNNVDLSKCTANELAEREEARDMKIMQAKKRMLGNIRFVGELYKLPQKMLQDKVMHRCVQKLLHVTNDDPDDAHAGPAQDADGRPILYEVSKLTEKDGEDIESLCKLLTTIGAKLESDASKDPFKEQLMVQYFERLRILATDRTFPSRVRFMVQDYFELRANNYVPRRKEDKQMTQEEMRRMAAREYGRCDGNTGNAVQQMGYAFGYKGNSSLSFHSQSKGTFRADQPRHSDVLSGKQFLHSDVVPSHSVHASRAAENPVARGDIVRVIQRSDEDGPLSPKELGKHLLSFITDWIMTENDQDTMQAWYSICARGGSVTGELLVSLAIERAVEARTSERNAIVALLVLLGNVSRKALKSSDVEAPLNKYLEYLEDTLCDIPALQSNLADVLVPLCKMDLISVETLERLMLLNMKGNAQLNKSTIYDFFFALEEKAGKLNFKEISAEAKVVKMRFSA